MAAALMDVQDIEVTLLCEGVFQRSGFDFRRYARAPLRRRVLAALESEGVATVSALQERVLRDRAALDRLIVALTDHSTALFRDPSFYRSLCAHVLPLLRTYPFVRVWHAGCSTGEEVDSLAIALHEHGLYERCRLYATDLSEEVLSVAAAGAYPLARLTEWTASYREAGGMRALSAYYTAAGERAVVRPWLRRNVVFATHDLGSGASFNDFHVILCRNVLIYFGPELQARAHALLHESLVPLGVLALGRGESLSDGPTRHAYQPIDRRERIFRRVA